MGYDRDDSFPFDFEPNEIPFGSKSIGKLSPRLYAIQCERKWKYSFLSAPSNSSEWNQAMLLGIVDIILIIDHSRTLLL